MELLDKTAVVCLFCTLIITLQLYCSSASSSVEICPSFSCNPNMRDTIQFPFHVPRNQSNRCGYPGFDLTCGRNGHTLLNISSKPLVVRGIYYPDQVLFVSDPNSCIPERILNMNLTPTPYSYGPVTPTYTFLNCSETNINDVDPDTLPIGTSVVSCLSKSDYTVMMTFERVSEEKPVDEKKCRVIKTVNAAFWWPEMNQGYYPADMSGVILQLNWGAPNCGDCILNGGYCGFANDFDLAVGCFFPPEPPGLPRKAKYGLLLGVGIPAIIVCMIGLALYIVKRTRAGNLNRRVTNTEASPSVFPQPVTFTFGLDRPTIESYPKTILGESKRLPKTSDGICPICLSEYQPKETLRSMPECNHYFHADCIDEWLRMNATCPLCRKSPHLRGAA